MKGKPKYKLGDKVKIYLSDELNKGWHEGEVYIIDKYGTFDDPSDVSYDIMIHDYRHPITPDKVTDCLCKHFTEKLVMLYETNNS